MIEIDDWMARQERDEMDRNPDGSHPGSAAAVRYTKCLVQVKVADIRANISRPAESYLRVHVGTIHVYLTAGLMDDPAYLPDGALEYAVCRRVRDHERRKGITVGCCLRFQVLHIDVSARITLDRHNPHSCHHCAGRVGAVGRLRDQAGGPVVIAAGAVVGPNDEQSGVFSL